MIFIQVILKLSKAGTDADMLPFFAQTRVSVANVLLPFEAHLKRRMALISRGKRNITVFTLSIITICTYLNSALNKI